MQKTEDRIAALEKLLSEQEADYQRFAVRYGVDTIGAEFKRHGVERTRGMLQELREGLER